MDDTAQKRYNFQAMHHPKAAFKSLAKNAGLGPMRPGTQQTTSMSYEAASVEKQSFQTTSSGIRRN